MIENPIKISHFQASDQSSIGQSQISQPALMKRTNHVWDKLADIGCGSLAGMAGKIIEFPFDTIKVRLQSQSEGGQLFRGPLDCFKQCMQAPGGIFSLYRGLSAPMLGAALENASLFFVYQATIGPLNGNSLAAGALSGIVASFILTPVELVKCRIQVQDVRGIARRSVSEVFRHILRTQGIRGFWQGQTGTLLREAGGSAAWFGAYDLVGSLLRKRRNASSCNTMESMIAGATAGMSYNLSLFPADTIKSRIQTNADLGKNQGFITTAKNIYSTGGIKAFYRGCGITVARAAPSSAIIFVVYENLKGIYEDRMGGEGEMR